MTLLIALVFLAAANLYQAVTYGRTIDRLTQRIEHLELDTIRQEQP